MDKGSAHKTFSASIENLHSILQFTRKHLEKVSDDQCFITQIELAIEEALVNIIKHGFHGASVPGKIEVGCHVEPSQKITIILTDNGIPYNPLLNVKKKNFSADMTGGYGIYLITSIMDEVSYEYKDDCNHLSLKKNIKHEDKGKMQI